MLNPLQFRNIPLNLSKFCNIPLNLSKFHENSANLMKYPQVVCVRSHPSLQSHRHPRSSLNNRHRESTAGPFLGDGIDGLLTRLRDDGGFQGENKSFRNNI